jgi:transposase-like protein
MTELLSNLSEGLQTPELMRYLANPGDGDLGSSPAAIYRAHDLKKRFGNEMVREIVHRYEDGESARSIAKSHDVSPSAIVRLLRAERVVVRRTTVTDALAKRMAMDYVAGATMAEIEKKFGLSHGAVYRALDRAGVERRPSSPRKKA